MDNFLTEKKRKHKDCSSVTHTTGDIGYNIKQFNKRMGTDFNNPSTEEARAQRAAEQAARSVGTFASQSPDGGSSASLGGGESAGGGECCGESLELREEKLYATKLGTYIELPPNIHLIDKQLVEDTLEELEPEEEFEIGYITPVYFYKELVDKFTLLKCTQLTGYTGIDYIEARANDDANREDRLKIARDTIALGSNNGLHLDRRPNAHQEGDFSANYASTNKTVLQKNGHTILFYPKVGSRPEVKYYLDLVNKNTGARTGYLPIDRNTLEQTILTYVKGISSKLSPGVAEKLRKQLETDAATINAKTLDKEDQ